jgi:hypothetical protein
VCSHIRNFHEVKTREVRGGLLEASLPRQPHYRLLTQCAALC